MAKKRKSKKKAKPESIGVRTQDLLLRLRERVSKASNEAIASSSAFLAEHDLLRWLGNLTQSPATAYDKALDAEYLRTHIGGGDHRLFDGGHDPISAWERVKDTLPNDTFAQEVAAYASSLWKDVTTIKGLPFETLDKEHFDAWVDALAGVVPGLDRQYLVDLASFDAFEVFSSTLGAVGLVFAIDRQDSKRIAEILGAMGIISIISANPLLGIVLIAMTSWAYVKKKIAVDKASIAKGGALAALSATIFYVLGLPILIELVIVLSVSHLCKKHVLDNEKLAQFFEGAADESRGVLAKFLEILAKSLRAAADGIGPAKPRYEL